MIEAAKALESGIPTCIEGSFSGGADMNISELDQTFASSFFEESIQRGGIGIDAGSTT